MSATPITVQKYHQIPPRVLFSAIRVCQFGRQQKKTKFRTLSSEKCPFGADFVRDLELIFDRKSLQPTVALSRINYRRPSRIQVPQ